MINLMFYILIFNLTINTSKCIGIYWDYSHTYGYSGGK